MKRILFIVTIVCGIFAQHDTLAQYTKYTGAARAGSMAQLIPWGDTIIFKGSTIQIGAHLRKGRVEAVEVENFGKSKKKDLEKGIFVVEVAPKKTTTYQAQYYVGGQRQNRRVTVYVVTSEEEKKAIEEKMIKEKANPLGISIGNVKMRTTDDGAKKDTTKSNTNKK